MVGICFYFEDNDLDVWSGREIDLDAWNYAAKAAGDVDRMIVVNRTAQRLRTPDAEIDFQIVTRLPQLQGRVVQVACPWDRAHGRRESLWTFDHQVDWYAFGPADGWDASYWDALYVPQAGAAALHAVHIASTVLLHRYEVMRWQ